MVELQLDVIQFIQHPDLLNDQSLSETQITVLKVTYGLPLTDRELEIYRRGTGCEAYNANEQREVTVIAGRRGGKTGKLAAPIACYQAFRDHGLPSGEVGYVMLLAPTLAQSQIAFRYIRHYICNSKVLSARVSRITDDEIRLKNNIVIGCYACAYARVRGRTIVAAICDEVSFWANENSANPVEEVLSALRPGMATVRDAKLIKISTPFIKSGPLWEEFSRRGELDFPVWQLTTFQLNPTVRPEDIEPERRLSEEKYRREYLAQFTDSINVWIDPERLEACIVRGRREFPRQSGVSYVAALDAAFRGDDFALVVAHLGPEECVAIDYVTTWRGTNRVPLAFESVLLQVKQILEMYGIDSVTGDQHQSDPIGQYLLKLGIRFKCFNFSGLTRCKLFSGLKYLLIQHKIALVDDIELVQQLRNLREENTERGHFDVQPSSGKDDRAVALALAVSEAIKQQLGLTIEVAPRDMPPSPASLGLIPGDCRVEAVCHNCPECSDVGYCLGFKDSRLITQIEYHQK